MAGIQGLIRSGNDVTHSLPQTLVAYCSTPLFAAICIRERNRLRVANHPSVVTDVTNTTRNRDARVTQLIDRAGQTLICIAQQHSLCNDDALDAYQRALEIFIGRLDSIDTETEVAWLKVVVKNEANAIRSERQETVNEQDIDFDAQPTATQRDTVEKCADLERVNRSLEAMKQLNPQETNALLLKARGHSYSEISTRFGWTFTRVNRYVTQGRKRFLQIYKNIESGTECKRFAPIITALTEGSATALQLLEARPHIRNCPSCRANVRQLHCFRLPHPVHVAQK